MDGPVPVPGTSGKVDLNAFCTRMKAHGLTQRNNGTWSLTKEACTWLQTHDDSFLLAVINANTKFIAEQLAQMRKPISERELYDIATEQYGLEWKKRGQISMRNELLCSLGFARYLSQVHLYELTELGRHWLETIEVVDPKSALESTVLMEAEIRVPSPWVIELANGLTVRELEQRGVPVGYIPGSSADLTETISKTIDFLSAPRKLADFDSFTVSTLASKNSQGYNSALRTLGLLKDIPDAIQATEIAIRWNEDPNPLDLAILLHVRRKFFLELLDILVDGPLTRNEIRARVQVRYGDSLDRSNLDRRIYFLRNAGLILGTKVLAVSDVGRKLLESIPVQPSLRQPDNDAPEVSSGKGTFIPSEELATLLVELSVASMDSRNPERFELACTEAFNRLGLVANHYGGVGNPDVVAKAGAVREHAYKIVIEAKSSASGRVGRKAVNFDAIAGHMNRFGAKYGIVVAPGYESIQINEHAKKHENLLLSVNDLSEVLRWHEEIPLTSRDYEKLFCQRGMAKINVLLPAREKLAQNGLLLQSVMRQMLEFGNVGRRRILLNGETLFPIMLKDSSVEAAIESKEQIDDVIIFLSSFLLGCLKKEGETKKYRAVGSLRELSSLLAYYSRICEEADSEYFIANGGDK